MTNVKPNTISHFVRKFALFLIQTYQILISPFTGGRAVCRFTPTCSEYTKQAIKKYGIIRGGIMGAKRISRCRPGGGFGFDPVP
ncbi:MAG: membrane protein insertion efficiency factor YidD [Alphaproteobacteria bacterium]|nr:membrane protein insertion efficiency factor YidD [Alphaproteobacteria bacterium]MBN2675322.1 membrane protein insertion efficiency factor YidD [Alphaproteobacteria bacterium]